MNVHHSVKLDATYIARCVRGFFFFAGAGLAGTVLAGAGGPFAPNVAVDFDPAPNTVSFTIQGCRTDGVRFFPVEFTEGEGGVLLGKGGDYFACEDPVFNSSNDDDYTSGNLGKNWQELDLVPYRLISVNGNSAVPVTYDVLVGADFEKVKSGATTVGFDVLSEPVMFRHSDGCDGATIEFGDQYSGGPVTGGADNTILRHVRIVDQPANSTCVLEWTARLALGSSAYSGSSLQAYMFETLTKSGKRTVPIPDVETPVGFSKTMLATQGSGYTWSVTKTATPTSVNFGDTCSPDFDPAADPQRVQIDVSWSKIGPTPSGSVAAVTEITISNPASRILQFDVADLLRTSDGATDLDTRSLANLECGDAFYDDKVHVDPRAEVVCTVEWDVDADDVFGNRLDDIATATLSDFGLNCEDFNCDLTTTAASDVSLTGDAENDTASVVDTETISNDNFTFVVDASSTFPGDLLPGAGFEIFAFDDPNEAVWTSGSVSDDGTATFYKDIYAASRIETSATLDDTAVLTMTDTQTTSSDSKSVAITTDPRVSLTIKKTIDFPLRAGESGDPDEVEFCFEVVGPSYPIGSEATPCVKFVKPETGESATELTKTLSNMDPGNYTVTEVNIPNGWTPTPTSYPAVTLDATSPATCATEVTFQNDPSSDVIAKGVKITHPGGPDGSPQAEGWTFALNKVLSGDALDELETLDTVCDGETEVCGVEFTTELEWGRYSITEEAMNGWDGVDSDDCEFEVTLIDLIAGKTFICTWTNTQRGDITIVKETAPAGEDIDFFFVEDITDVGTFTLDGVPGTNEWSTDANSVVPGDYAVRESDPSPDCDLTENPCTQEWDLLSVTCDNDDPYNLNDSDQDGTDPNQVNIVLDPGESESCTFINQQRGTIRIEKSELGGTVADGEWTFDIRQGASGSATGTILATDSTVSAVVDFEGAYFVPGDYQLCEHGVLPAWMTSLTSITGWFTPPDGGDKVCADFTLDPGEQPELFQVLNTPPEGEEPGGGMARTIGFWRNWSGDCTPGHQENVLGRWLGLDPEDGDADASVDIGQLSWPLDNTLTDAVNIISKRNIDVDDSSALPCQRGENRASDPAYAMASQFLAYQLNVNAGTSECGLAQAASDAQWLLYDYLDFTGFDKGTGKKKDVLWVGKRDDYVSEFRSLATLFDQYNNKDHDDDGLECPVTDYVAIDRGK